MAKPGKTAAPTVTSAAPPVPPEASAPAKAPALRPIERATTGTRSGVLGSFTASAEGCTVQFRSGPQEFSLAMTAPNYNALFSLLLACKCNEYKLTLTYANPLITVSLNATDGPLRIVSITADSE